MSELTAIIAVGIAVTYLAIGTAIAGMMMRSEERDPDPDDWPFAAIFVLFWPLYAVLWLMSRPVVWIARRGR